jgi:hypothetical protein
MILTTDQANGLIERLGGLDNAKLIIKNMPDKAVICLVNRKSTEVLFTHYSDKQYCILYWNYPNKCWVETPFTNSRDLLDFWESCTGKDSIVPIVLKTLADVICWKLSQQGGTA